MPTYGSVLTVIGAAQIANSQITGVAPVWTAMGVGDGGGHVVTPSAERTALVREVYRGQINTLYRAGDDETQIVAELVIQPQTGGWTLREVGIYDADGNLVVYGSLPEMVKPVLAEGSGVTTVIRARVAVGSNGNVTLKIDPSIVIATRKYVDDCLKKYLPLAGGTLTGNLSSSAVDFNLYKANAAGRIVVRGGSQYANGGSLYLYGKDYDSSDPNLPNEDPGSVVLVAHDGARSSVLKMKPNGTFSLNAKDVATTLSNVASATKLETPRKINGKYFDGTADINVEDNSKLPLAGGMLTGNLSSSAVDFNLYKANAAGRIVVRGGSQYANGGSLYLYGKDYDSSDPNLPNEDPGSVVLVAHDGARSSVLKMKSDGTFTINGKALALETDLESSGTDYIRLKSGVQICYGNVQITNGASGNSITFPQPFSAAPSVQATPVTQTVGIGVDSISATATMIKTTTAAYVRWLAVGRWSQGV
ncbi:phage tail protein [Pyramidobacter piscolens]|uniref:phage tail protein n=1 Tax=Pyramidobacter piscolens TaxID=638849 RepID=UPI00266B5CE7|nr:phage tail protein [Pyramidobacter piscolens]